MRTYRTTTGPFSEAVYYEPKDIEQICLDELRATSLLPDAPAPVRIERFLEKKFSVTPVYEDLPEGILGFTRFSSNGVEEVVISRTLCEEGTKVAERRLSTTMAHEAGHGLLHAHLFALEDLGQSLPLEGVDRAARKILCRSGAITGGGTTPARRYDGRWWEVQANRAIGALLLPKPLVEEALNSLLGTGGAFGTRVLESARRREAAALLAEVFDVNPAVARIRLQDLHPVANGAQLTF